MSITPMQIKEQQFRIRFRGFDVREVDGFLEQIADELKDLVAESEGAGKEVERLNRQLQEFRDREKNFKDAMVNAQKAFDDMRINAEKEAELILAEAEIKAEKVLSSAHNRVIQLHEDIAELKRQRLQVEVELGSMLDAHRKLLDMSTEAMNAEETAEEKIKYLKGM